jgi:hypothetical protein
MATDGMDFHRNVLKNFVINLTIFEVPVVLSLFPVNKAGRID